MSAHCESASLFINCLRVFPLLSWQKLRIYKLVENISDQFAYNYVKIVTKKKFKIQHTMTWCHMGSFVVCNSHAVNEIYENWNLVKFHRTCSEILIVEKITDFVVLLYKRNTRVLSLNYTVTDCSANGKIWNALPTILELEIDIAHDF